MDRPCLLFMETSCVTWFWAVYGSPGLMSVVSFDFE